MVDGLMHKVPTPGELVQLIEKQDNVMSAIHDELEACKEQLSSMEQEQEKKYGDLPNQIVEEANSRLQTALEAIERLQNENYELEEELHSIKEKVAGERPIPSVLALNDQLKEISIELELSKRNETNLNQELKDERRKCESQRAEFELNARTKQDSIISLMEKVEELEKECAEAKMKLEGFTSNKEIEVAQLKSEKDLMTEKSNQLNSLCEQYSKEISNLRRETSTTKSRLSILNQENMHLRTQSLRNVPVEDHLGGCSKEVSKLLGDQSHLIAVLREEIKLMTVRLEQERRESKLKVKLIKNENAELQSRLDKLLRID